MKGKNEKAVAKEEPQEERTGGGAVDQIKKKYGYTLSAVSVRTKNFSTSF